MHCRSCFPQMTYCLCGSSHPSPPLQSSARGIFAEVTMQLPPGDMPEFLFLHSHNHESSQERRRPLDFQGPLARLLCPQQDLRNPTEPCTLLLRPHPFPMALLRDASMFNAKEAALLQETVGLLLIIPGPILSFLCSLVSTRSFSFSIYQLLL